MTTVTVHGGRPAVNVKVQNFGGQDLISAIQGRFGCDQETAEQASEMAWDSAVSNFWNYWQEPNVDGDGAHQLEYYFGSGVTADCAGRSGGWLEVHGLPDPVEDWGPALVAKWAKFEADVLADVEHYSAAETILDDIESSRWARRVVPTSPCQCGIALRSAQAEPGAELFNFHEVDGKIVCRVDEQRIRDAAPDLLAASRDALESLRRLPSTPDAYRVTCISQLESAIAKATGGQS